MTWTYPKFLRNLLPDVQALDSRFVSEFGSDTGFAFGAGDSGDGPARIVLVTSLNARATALVPVCPTDGRANEIAWRMNRWGAFKVSGYPGDTGRAGV
jgi:hypothetical protein